MTLSRLFLGAVFALAALIASGDGLQAQPGAPGRPAFSPYLNLLRPGGSPALNYYGLVRPEINTRQSVQSVQSSTVANQRSIGDILNGAELPATGLTSQFLNHNAYFLNQGTGGRGGARSGGGGGGGGARR